jgi:hypothetical protein
MMIKKVSDGAAAGFKNLLEERFLKISKDFYPRDQHVSYNTSRLTRHYLTQ